MLGEGWETPERLLPVSTAALWERARCSSGMLLCCCQAFVSFVWRWYRAHNV